MFSLIELVHGQGVVYVSPNPQPTYSMSGVPYEVLLDINGDGTPDFILRTQDPDTSINNAVLVPLGSSGIVTANGYVANLNFGDVIGPSSSWTTSKTTIGTLAIFEGGTSAENGNFAGQTNGYIGFDLMSGGTNYYGWMYVSAPNQSGLAGDAGIYGTITEWAYQSLPNTPIFAGEVPEPSTWALLGLGAASMLARRKFLGAH